MLTRKAFSEADPNLPARGSPLVSEKLSCDMWIGFHRWNYIYSATTWHKKWYCLGCSCCSKLRLKRDLLRSKLLIRKRWRDINFVRTISKTKTLRKLVVCGVENVIVIKMSFCCLADVAVLNTQFTHLFQVLVKTKMMVNWSTQKLSNRVKVDGIQAHVTPYLLAWKWN